MPVSADQFRKLFPANHEPDDWTAALNAVLPRYGINTPLRLAAFLAQCGHESQDFTAIRENLNYNAAGLLSTWPKRFTAVTAQQYSRQPERIANHVYANRIGNGTEESGDGWKHRGRGVLQVTGKANYIAFAKAADKSYEEVFAYLETKEGAVESACWYWKNNNLNVLADAGRNDVLTRIINGGYNGLADRNVRYAAATQIFSA